MATKKTTAKKQRPSTIATTEGIAEVIQWPSLAEQEVKLRAIEEESAKKKAAKPAKPVDPDALPGLTGDEVRANRKARPAEPAGDEPKAPAAKTTHRDDALLALIGACDQDGKTPGAAATLLQRIDAVRATAEFLGKDESMRVLGSLEKGNTGDPSPLLLALRLAAVRIGWSKGTTDPASGGSMKSNGRVKGNSGLRSVSTIGGGPGIYALRLPDGFKGASHVAVTTGEDDDGAFLTIRMLPAAVKP